MPKGYTRPDKKTGSIIRKERERMKMTRDEFADKVGCCAGTIAAIENGSRGIGRDIFDRLLETIGCDEDYLLGRSPYKNADVRRLENDLDLKEQYSTAAGALEEYFKVAFHAERFISIYKILSKTKQGSSERIVYGKPHDSEIMQDLVSAEEYDYQILYDVYKTPDRLLYVNVGEYRKAIVRLNRFMDMTVHELIENISPAVLSPILGSDETMQDYLRKQLQDNQHEGTDISAGSSSGGADQDQEGRKQ